MLKCLQKVCEGECWFEEALAASFLSLRTVRPTRRESQLVNLVAQGHKKIAGQMNLLAGGGQPQVPAANSPRPPVLLVEDKALAGEPRPASPRAGACLPFPAEKRVS